MNIQEKKLNDELDESELERYNVPFNINQPNELFDDEAAAQKHTLINVRRISLPRKGERWELYENECKIFVLKGTQLTKKERAVLRTIDGINLVIQEYKLGHKSVYKIKAALRHYWKTHG